MSSNAQRPPHLPEKTESGLFSNPALLALGLIAILAVIGIYALLFGQVDTPLTYNPEDVIYDQPLHGGYILESHRTTVAFPDLDDPLPLMALPSKFHDMGRVRAESPLTHVFVIQNMGVAPLTIVQLYTTCDYVTADVSGSIIPPGKIALLTITLDTVRAYELGQRMVRRGAVLTTNDPYQRESTVWVQALIAP